MTLRHRLQCSIKTVESVSTMDGEETCPVTPVEKFFTSQEKASWMREEKTLKKMLVSANASNTILVRTYGLVHVCIKC